MAQGGPDAGFTSLFACGALAMPAAMPISEAQEARARSGACTPDFLVARARPADDGPAQHSEGVATPRDGTMVSKLSMQQLCSKLRDMELRKVQLPKAPPTPIAENAFAMPDVQKVPLPLWALTGGSRPLQAAPSAPAPCAMAAAPPPGLALPSAWPRHAPTEYGAALAGADAAHTPPRAKPIISIAVAQAPPPPKPAQPRPRAPGAAKFVVSVGSVGHPAECSEMCGAEECGLGAGCPKCHMCRAELQAHEAHIIEEAMRSIEPCPCIGSIGHPLSCAEPCKFFSKARGCKDGANCTRCHLCLWNRYHTRIGRWRREGEDGEDSEAAA